jgi:3-hydroxy-9,10-secoandrosta-1,3,5(10)-triene-9,17-dione monooxygenase reductase component
MVYIIRNIVTIRNNSAFFEMSTNTNDARNLRGALGQFATGVTVITTVDGDKSPVGVTASSFNSVSLDPPLVLWSLAKTARSMKAFEESGYFCVHVLGASQEELSARFATPGSDKFAGQEWIPGHGEVPLLPDFAARFQCKTTHMYEGGDHLIFVGEVLDYEKSDEPPLVFHGGRYALAKSKGQGEKPGAAVDITHGTFTENFFLYLIARAHFQASAPLRKEYARANINEDEYLALTMLGLGGPLSLQALQVRLEHTGHTPSHATVNGMIDKGYVTETVDGTQFSITVKGRELYLKLLAKSKAIEEDLLAEFSDAEISDVRNFLQRFIKRTDPGIPDFWQADGNGSG